MILKHVIKSSFLMNNSNILLKQPKYSMGTWQKLKLLIRGILNKMANQDNRTFSDKIVQRNDNSITQGYKIAQTRLQAQKQFKQIQTTQYVAQKSRLQRIDQILGTNTYYHPTKQYQTRIGHDHVMNIQMLYTKLRQKPRDKVDLDNPQMIKIDKILSNKKFVRNLIKYRKYPIGNIDTRILQQSSSTNANKDNPQLINFLTQQTLFTNLSLMHLKQTAQSIMKQKLIMNKQGTIIDLQQQQEQYVNRGMVYFRPNELTSLYRIDKQKYNSKLKSSVYELEQAVIRNQGNIQEVINLDQIYQCLKQYYYDDRVSQYLKKIQNNKMEYLFSSICISPDRESVFVSIDLLNTNKQYVGLFKRIGSSKNPLNGIIKQNIVFNYKIDVQLHNKGQLYMIQRSQQGMYTQLTQVDFNMGIYENNKTTKKIQINKYNQLIVEEQKKQIQQAKSKYKIIYRCAPHLQLTIDKKSKSSIEVKNKFYESYHIVVNESQIGTKLNNKLYLFTKVSRDIGNGSNSEDGSDIIKQQITLNNSTQGLQKIFIKQDVKNRYKDIDNWQKNCKKLYTQCHEVFQVGYIIIRYELAQNNYYKFGYNQKYAKYATLIPYKKYNETTGSNNRQKYDKKLLKSSSLAKVDQIQAKNIDKNKNQIAEVENNKSFNIEQLQINLPSEQSSNLYNPENQTKQNTQLDHQNQYIIYCVPSNQYFYNAQIKSTSQSNIYLLMNMSFQSIYNRQSLSVYPLRKGISPYSIYLDGFPVNITQKITAETGKIDLKLKAPLLSVNVEYNLWKKQVKQVLNDRIYSEVLTIKESQQCDITIKLLSSHKFIKKSKTQNRNQHQMAILYLPSGKERIDQIVLRKLLEKGVVFVQIIKCRGILRTNMIQLLRGSKQNHVNYIQDIHYAIEFIKQNIGERVSVYAEGPSSCFATLLLNITQNQQNQLFDSCVLHEGKYDLNKLNAYGQYFFGRDPNIFKQSNMYEYPVFNPKNPLPFAEVPKQICNMSNILFTSLSEDQRIQSRKFINKLRTQNLIIYQQVYLKQFDQADQKDIFSLSYMFNIMKKKLKNDQVAFMKTKMQKVLDKGLAKSRDSVHKTSKQQNIQ